MFQAFHGLAIQEVATFGGGVEQPEQRQQRGFATPRRAGNRYVFSDANLQMNVGQRVCLDLFRKEDLGDFLHLNQRLVALVHVRSGHPGWMPHLWIDISRLETFS